MKLLSFSVAEVVKVGLLTDKGVLDLPACYKTFYDDEVPVWLYSMRSFLAAGEDAFNLALKLERKASGYGANEPLFHRLSEVTFKAPVPDAKKILCVAANYVAHGREMNIKIPERPYFFGKYPNSLAGHEENVLIPKTSTKVDHEVELGVVIGKRGKYITKDKAYEYIAGYTVFNDVSFRDKQFPDGWPHQLNPYGQNWILGKSLDTAAPCGPYLVTKDEVGSPYPLRLLLRVNGEVRQEGSTDEMYYKIGDLIEYISDGLTLEPGDIIATGTPAGVAAAGRPFLKENDVMEAEIEKIGLLRNRLVKET
ncbi:MAG: fumarylacetoacetate hydrolase family protein [Thaumarchaeota archaeon]|nr:fumarylacetoacetate hydrolase family protein [Candidatus Calditenuaceae archaeon]MDW8042397.1 fumarylacetoacetate hydrolase family protein [Nitrososphaerota archaeon]